MAKKLQKSVKGYPYIPPRIVHNLDKIHPRHGDIEYRWLIKYYAWDLDLQKLRLLRFYAINKEGNRWLSFQDRMKRARRAVIEISKMLHDGYVVERKIKKPKLPNYNYRNLTIEKAFLEAIELKSATLKRSSAKNFNALKKIWIPWLTSKNYANAKMSKFSPIIVQEFWEDELKLGVRSNRTIKNYVGDIKHLVESQMKKKDLSLKIHEIPLPTFSTEQRLHAAYNSEQMQLIKKACLETDNQYLLDYITTVFYTLARPKTELRLMKVEQVDLNDNRIFIPSGSAKNKKGRWIDIYPPLKKVLIKWNLSQYPGDYYLFSIDQKPGLKPTGINYFYKKNKKILDYTGLSDLMMEYTLYGYKHSGAINLYTSIQSKQNASKAIRIVKNQCGHGSEKETEIYLRSLNVLRLSDHFDNVKEF
ncbi:MAG: hypothetical protein AAF363_15810 [Bacteroidota bacterium]